MSKLIECPSCKKKISIDANSCPKCGQPLTEDIKNKILEKQKQDKKNAKSGCLILVIAFIIAVVYFTKTSPDHYFSFNEEQFINAFKSRINHENSVNHFGNIEITKAKSNDKNISSYALNNDALLKIIGDGNNHGIWKICVQYDNDKDYDEKVVLGSSLATLLAFSDLGYLGAFDFKPPYEYLRTEVMSKQKNERGRVESKSYKKDKIVNDKKVPTAEIQIKPIYDSLCIQSLEEH